MTSDTLAGILTSSRQVQVLVGDGSELTVMEAQRLLNVSDTTVRRYVAEHWLRARWTAGGHTRIEPASVEELLPILRIRSRAKRDAAMAELQRRNRKAAGEEIEDETAPAPKQGPEQGPQEDS